MDPKDVARPSDIMMAADTLLHAKPIEPITKPGTEPDPAKPADPAEPAEPAIDDAPAIDGQPAPDDADQALNDPLKARADELARREAAFEEAQKRANAEMERIFKDPNEYERARRELGLVDDETAKPVTPAKPAGPDPIENPDAWRYRRTQAYTKAARERKADWTAEQIEDAVEQDLRDARDAVYQSKIQEIDQRLSKREQAEQQTAAAARASQAKAALDAALAPLLASAYPKGVSPDAREQIDAFVALARERGQKPDLAAIVARVSGAPRKIVTDYVNQKKTMNNGSNAARGSGSSSPAPVSIIDQLPATLESIGKIGEMRAAGKLK